MYKWTSRCQSPSSQFCDLLEKSVCFFLEMKKQNDSDKYLLLQEQSAEKWNYLLTFFARFSVNFPCWHKCKSAYSLTNWLTLALLGWVFLELCTQTEEWDLNITKKSSPALVSRWQIWSFCFGDGSGRESALGRGSGRIQISWWEEKNPYKFISSNSSCSRA